MRSVDIVGIGPSGEGRRDNAERQLSQRVASAIPHLGHSAVSILEPDKEMVPGYPPGLMKATLSGTNFYQNISVDGLEKLVDYLASLKGKS